MSSGNIYKLSGTVSSTEDLPVRYDLYTPSVNGRELLPVILFLHGFKGFKDWGPFPDACEELCRAGFAVVALNFSLNGIGDDLVTHSRLDLFERETLSQDLSDVGAVIEAVKNGSIVSSRVGLDTDRMGILGHSRGGHTAIVAAAEYPEIQCMVALAPVADYSTHLSESMYNDFKSQGFTEILNSRTGQVMKVGRVVMDDLLANREKLIAIDRIRELHIPALFITGQDDETVPPSDSKQLYRSCPSELKEIRLISDTGHTFGAIHPFEGDDFPEKFLEVLDLSIGWFHEHLA